MTPFLHRPWRSLVRAALWSALTLVCGHARADVTLTGDTSRPAVSTFAAGEAVTLDFHATGLTPGGAGISLKLDFANEHDAVLEHRDVPVMGDAAGAWSATVPAPSKRLGFYRVSARLSDGTPLAPEGTRHGSYLTYIVVPDPSRRKLYPQDVTRFGMQGGFSDAINPLLPYLGIRWVMARGGWDTYEPDHAGQFAETAAAAKAAGKSVLDKPKATEGAVYGGKPWAVFTYPSLNGLPKWASDLSAPKANNYPLKPGSEAAWADYARAYAQARRAAYPNEPCRLYQITWEPDYPWGFSGTPEQLVHIYESCYVAIHEGDPNALVVGPTYAGFEEALTEATLKAGIGRYLDGFAIHPYFGADPEANGFLEQVRAQADQLRQYAGKTLPRSGSEEGFATGDDRAKELQQAQTLTRQNLMLLGEGYWFNFAFYVADFTGEPGYGYYYNLKAPHPDFGTDKVCPKPVAAVYAAQSFLLDGARSAGSIEWLGPTTLGYAFERDGQVTLALWDYGDKPRPVSVPIGVPRVTVYDWMGNPRPAVSPGGSLTLTLGPEPVYVVGAAPALWGLNAQKPLRLASSRLTTFPGATARIVADLVPGPKPLRGTLTLTPDARLGLPPLVQSVSAPAGAHRTITLRVPIPADAQTGGYTATLTLRQAGQILAGGGVRLDIQPPAAVVAVTPLQGVGGKGLAVTLREAQGAALRGTLRTRLAGVPGSKADVPFTLAPHETRTFSLTSTDLDVTPARTYQANVRVETAAGYGFERQFPTDYLSAPRLLSPPTIDGSLGEWQGLTPVTLAGRGAVVRSPQYYDGHLAAKVYYAWDAKNLYLAADVSDARFVQEQTGALTWKGDSLQLGFDADTGKPLSQTGNGILDAATRHRSQEIDLALTPGGPEAFRSASYDAARMPVGLLAPSDLTLAVTRVEGKISYEAAIPWRTLGRVDAPKSGDRLGVALTVNDMDDSKQLDPTALGLYGGIADSKDIGRYGVLTLGEAPAPAAAFAPPGLTFSGALGQSQTGGADPVPFVGVSGAATDTAGTLWTAAGDRLYDFTERGGRYALTRQVPLPSPVSQNLQSDGRRCFFLGGDNKLYVFDPTLAGAVPQALCAVDPKARAFAVAPASLRKGYAARARLFVLAGNAVTAYGADGSSLGTALTLPPPPSEAWSYDALGIEPSNGDLLVGSYYPDDKIYRYGVDGKAVTAGGWPRPLFSTGIEAVGGVAWATLSGGGAQALPASLTSGAAQLEPGWTHYATGLASDGSGGYWLASSQGLTRFDKHGRSLHQRLGGLSGVRTLALTADGTVLAGVEGGQRQIRLGLDDDPDTPLASNANEPWRMGGGWSDRACAVAPDGGAFLVLDETAKSFWRFDPAKTAWGETPWAKVPVPDGLTAPRTFALGTEFAWILDGNRLLEAPRTDLSHAHAVALPPGMDLAGASALAAGEDDRLFLADATHVRALDRHADGTYTLAWRAAAPFVSVAGLAAASRGLLVSDSGAGTVTLLSPQTGAALVQLAAKDVPGGWKPGAVAESGAWAVVADARNARLVRVRVSGGPAVGGVDKDRHP